MDVDNNLDSNEDETVIDTINHSILLSNGKLDSYVKTEGSKEAESTSFVVDAKGANTTINVQDRQNSFQATRNFFANQGGGLIISPKKYKKAMEEFPENQHYEQSNYPHKMSNK